MEKIILRLLVFVMLGSGCSQSPSSSHFSKTKAEQALKVCLAQYKLMEEQLPEYNRYPKTISLVDNSLETCNSGWWACGFFPGSLWYLYDYSKDTFFLDQARLRTAPLEKEKFNTGTHDLGFMLYCSFGNGYRLTDDTSYKPILLTGAQSLASRFNPKTGCIQSWRANDKWDFPVIIDNMMNLEFLFWAAKNSGDTSLLSICKSHALTTLKNHFRGDYSSYHLVDYNPETGQVQKKQTVQGLNDQSAWARGQAWGLYGYTVVFRETGDSIYLHQAQHIAGFILSNPNRPVDGVPYWDFDAPGKADTLRDVSAGAIIASALLDLSRYSKSELQARYVEAAGKLLNSLSGPKYLAKIGTNNHFILKHSVGNYPAHSEVDVPLSYADYYYIEALLRYLKVREQTSAKE